jgi:hypothetical protein
LDPAIDRDAAHGSYPGFTSEVTLRITIRLFSRIVHRHDNYVDVPDPSDALDFGTQGFSFRARKPVL